MAGRNLQIDAEVRGREALSRELSLFAGRLRRSVLQKPLRDSMPMLRSTIAGVAPVLDKNKRGSAWMLKRGARKRGLVSRSVKVLPSSLQRKRGNVGVWLTVTRPKGGGTSTGVLAGTKVKKFKPRDPRGKGKFVFLKKDGKASAVYRPNDPFYFKFLERGTKHIPAEKYQFIGRIAQGPMGDNTLRIATRKSIEAIQQLRITQKP